MSTVVQKLVNRLGFRIHRIDELTRLMNQAGSDKGLGLRGRHGYTRIYHKLLSSRRKEPLTFVEIGLLRTDWDKRRSRNGEEGAPPLKASGAPSLKAWRRFFPRAKIVGFDIDDFSEVRMPEVTILRGDMSRREDLLRIADECQNAMDIVIDDGSHASHHQQLAFATLFPFVKPGGLYIIEDCHWQDPYFEIDEFSPTRSVLHAWRTDQRLVIPHLSRERAGELAGWIEKIEFYDSLEPDIADVEDALCVIHKKIEG